jgi:hypothetical protein
MLGATAGTAQRKEASAAQHRHLLSRLHQLLPLLLQRLQLRLLLLHPLRHLRQVELQARPLLLQRRVAAGQGLALLGQAPALLSAGLQLLQPGLQPLPRQPGLNQLGLQASSQLRALLGGPLAGLQPPLRLLQPARQPPLLSGGRSGSSAQLAQLQAEPVGLPGRGEEGRGWSGSLQLAPRSLHQLAELWQQPGSSSTEALDRRLGPPRTSQARQRLGRRRAPRQATCLGGEAAVLQQQLALL